MSRNVTATVARYSAGSVDVCRVGGTVVLHMHTTSGVVLVDMRERDFLTAFRGPTDANGHPFRTAALLDAEKSLLVEALDNSDPRSSALSAVK